VDHLGHGRCGEAEEVGEARRNDMATLVGERIDGLQVLLDGR
jgi:hypothetical protein